MMRPVLGEVLWAEFVHHANQRYKKAFLDVFDAPTLCCVGQRDGTPCPKHFKVDLCSPSAYDSLERLHLDHEHDVRVTCDMWKRALSPNAAAWVGRRGLDEITLDLSFVITLDRLYARFVLVGG